MPHPLTTALAAAIAAVSQATAAQDEVAMDAAGAACARLLGDVDRALAAAPVRAMGGAKVGDDPMPCAGCGKVLRCAAEKYGASATAAICGDCYLDGVELPGAAIPGAMPLFVDVEPEPAADVAAGLPINEFWDNEADAAYDKL